MIDVYNTPLSYDLYNKAAINAMLKQLSTQKNIQKTYAFLLAHTINAKLTKRHKFCENKNASVIFFCGGDDKGAMGYYVAVFLAELGLRVRVVVSALPSTTSNQIAKNDVFNSHSLAGRALLCGFAPKCFDVNAVDFTALTYYAVNDGGDIIDLNGFDDEVVLDGVIDAMAIANRPSSHQAHQAIMAFNRYTCPKIALICPAGLDSDTGDGAVSVRADMTLAMALGAGFFVGDGKDCVGQLLLLPCFELKQQESQPIATLDSQKPLLPKRWHNSHKGDFGSVAVIGGGAGMGGAVLMASTAAMAVGAGKLTAICADSHHSAIIAHNPNVMTKNIEHLSQDDLDTMTAIAFGMGLGRDSWAYKQYRRIMALLPATATVVLDADALYFLAKSFYQPSFKRLSPNTIATPHDGEAARLLGLSSYQVAKDRLRAIHALKARYGGQWVLKGAGSLSLVDGVYICPFGNAAMATAGMGDILAGVIVGLKAQFYELPLYQCVALHALAGDRLAQAGNRSIQAPQMADALCQVLNDG